MFKLNISNNDASGGNLAVSWCVDAELLKILADYDVKDPMVVLVVAPEGEAYHIRKEYRKVVPLKDLMAYVELRSAGKNNIWGFVSFRSKKSAKVYLDKEHGEYDTTILNSDGDDYNHRYYDIDIGKSEPISIDVPSEVFAKEPSETEKAWVNWLFKNKCVDQCEFRKRRAFAYTLQFPLAMLYILLKCFFVLFAMMIGSRGLTTEYILNPFRFDMLEYFTMAFGKDLPFDHGTHFIGRGTNKFLNWARLPFMPIIMVTLFWLVKILSINSVISFLVIGIVASVFLCGGGTAFITNYIVKEKIKKEKPTNFWYMNKKEVYNILCSSDRKSPKSIFDLPSEKRSIRLYYQEIKSRVCRPFSV